MNELLSPAEIRELVGCVAREAQCSKLDAFGIPYKRDGGRILVSRVHVRSWLAGEVLRAPVGPRLDLVR